MSDQKTERLLNLTMALLATRKYLTKGEIFQSVAGYGGSTESMERMFERDKDDLRSLGIEIEVGSLDAYFEDEFGYLIQPDQYGLDLGELTPRELALISVATNSWTNSTLSASAQSALRKLRSLGVPIDSEELGMGWVKFENQQPNFDQIWQAFEARKSIRFNYCSTVTSIRNVNPYGLTLWRGFWYLIGFDLDKKEVRVFKISRIDGPIELFGRANSYEIPPGFNITDHIKVLVPEEPKIAELEVRKNRGHVFRTSGSCSPIDEEWDQIRVHYDYEEAFLRKILWFGADVKVISPTDLVTKIVGRLEGLLK
jgi:proteasome accessory factor B